MRRVLTDYVMILKLQYLDQRISIVIISVINLGFIAGFVYGYGYLYGEMPEYVATVLTTGAATNAFIFVALVMLPQVLAEQKYDGRLDYLRTLPISREAYVFAMVTFVGTVGIPSSVLALVVGAWRYDLSLSIEPAVLAVAPLAVLSLAGFGAAIGIVIPRLQTVNAITQITIFYVVFFAPVMVPRENLPSLLQRLADLLPPTYAADAMRAATTDLPDTHLVRSLVMLTAFAAVSLVAASAAMRRRG